MGFEDYLNMAGVMKKGKITEAKTQPKSEAFVVFKNLEVHFTVYKFAANTNIESWFTNEAKIENAIMSGSCTTAVNL